VTYHTGIQGSSSRRRVLVDGDNWTIGQLAIPSIFQITVLGLCFAALDSRLGLAAFAGGGILGFSTSFPGLASDLGRRRPLVA
jgi:hypothetical protein